MDSVRAPLYALMLLSLTLSCWSFPLPQGYQGQQPQQDPRRQGPPPPPPSHNPPGSPNLPPAVPGQQPPYPPALPGQPQPYLPPPAPQSFPPGSPNHPHPPPQFSSGQQPPFLQAPPNFPQGAQPIPPEQQQNPSGQQHQGQPQQGGQPHQWHPQLGPPPDQRQNQYQNQFPAVPNYDPNVARKEQAAPPSYQPELPQPDQQSKGQSEILDKNHLSQGQEAVPETNPETVGPQPENEFESGSNPQPLSPEANELVNAEVKELAENIAEAVVQFVEQDEALAVEEELGEPQPLSQAERNHGWSVTAPILLLLLEQIIIFIE